MKKLINTLAITSIVVASMGNLAAAASPSVLDGNQATYVPATLTGAIYSEGPYFLCPQTTIVTTTNVVRKSANFFAHTPAVNTTNYATSTSTIQYLNYNTTVFKLSDYITTLNANLGLNVSTNSQLVFATAPNWSHPLIGVGLVSGTNTYVFSDTNVLWGDSGVDFSVTGGKYSDLRQQSGSVYTNQAINAEYYASSFTNIGNVYFTLNTSTNGDIRNVQFQINGQYVFVQNAASANLSATNGTSYTSVSAILMGTVWTNDTKVGIFSGTLNANATTNRVDFRR